MKKEITEKSYKLARDQYAALGVDTDKVIEDMSNFSLSLHCWQTDDVGGFEKPGAELGGGGIQVTGNFPGKSNHYQTNERRSRKGILAFSRQKKT